MNHVALFLKDIYFSKRTGRLTFSRSGIQKSFFFQAGGMLFAKTNVSEERLGEILLRTGKISADTHQQISRYAQPQLLLGESLVQNKVLSQRDLYDGLLAQMYAVMLGCFIFYDGEIAFHDRDSYLDAEFELRVSVPLLLEKGVRSMSFHPALHAFFSGKTMVSLAGTFESYLDDKERALWSRLDGSTAIEYVMTREAAEPNWFWKTLFLFYVLGLADFKPEPVRETEAVPPAPPLMPEGEAAIVKSEGESKTDDLDVRLHEALELRRKIGNLDQYQLLGLSKTADETEIKKAYFKLARRFHPDLFGRNLDPQLRSQIEELFDRITKAYRALSTRTEKDAAAAPAAVRAAEDGKDGGKSADTRFRQGKTLYSQARYEEAVQYLEEAVRLKEDKGDYFLLLAMAESKIRGQSKKAERDFLRAIELEPWNPEAVVGLGLLYKREGLLARAKRQFERAVEIDAQHPTARQELEYLAGTGEEKKGLKGFFSTDFFGSKKK
jgi:tetratricopeptide (TPR) repeat protein